MPKEFKPSKIRYFWSNTCPVLKQKHHGDVHIEQNVVHCKYCGAIKPWRSVKEYKKYMRRLKA